jgi:hypothetical protein
VNKPGSKLDTEQKEKGAYYYVTTEKGGNVETEPPQSS